MIPDLWSLYPLMLKSRLFEEVTASLWQSGLISGELHLGTGEEAIIAGVVVQLQEGDAMALDHRGTAAMLMRGVDPLLILREMLGLPDGLCHGMGGHMHLYAPEYLAASSGIVGAAGPTAAGFALSAQLLRPGAVAVAFFGEGAMNQGMLIESLNLASVWNLPVLFVCKDDRWSITTESESQTGGSLDERASAFGLTVFTVDGTDVSVVWKAAQAALEQARSGGGPSFLHARCMHFEGHFLGFPLLKIVRDPFRELPGISAPLVQSFFKTGAATGLGERLAGMKEILGALLSSFRDSRQVSENDPLVRVRKQLTYDPGRLAELEDQVEVEINLILANSLKQVAI